MTEGSAAFTRSPPSRMSLLFRYGTLFELRFGAFSSSLVLKAAAAAQLTAAACWDGTKAS
jgi:hypothetical protein